MRALLLVATAILAVGLLFTVERPNPAVRTAPHAETLRSVGAVRSVAQPKARSSIAAYPDRGQLLAYDSERKVVRIGASTWRPMQISEAHALRAISEGAMTIPAPNGEMIRLRYERHVEHSGGNWTWIGREDGGAPGTETVLTFGEKAVFGTIRNANADLSVTTVTGSTWLVETDYSRVDPNRLAAMSNDVAVPAGLPDVKSMSLKAPMKTASASAEPLGSMSAEVTPLTPTTVDIVMGFTTGFATRLGGESQARTRLDFLVDTANQAYLASGINAQIRLLNSMQVDYPDGNVNFSALFDLTGMNCTEQANGARYMSSSRWDCTPVERPVGLQALAAARDSHGADLLVLVRKFEATSESCGMAWMLGGGQNAIDANSAAFGMTVVNDTSGIMFPDNDITCPDWQLAHELGHNMGQQHDLVTAMGSDDTDTNGSLLDPEEFGRHPYSFGYSTDGTASDVATIMSNRRPSQTRYRVFANPLISACGNAPCGIADQADNARSMMETMPIVATFRNHAPRDINADGRTDLLWQNTGTSQLFYWAMNSQAIVGGQGKTLPPGYTSRAVADLNGDGRVDVVISNGSDLRLIPTTASGGFGVSVAITGYPVGWTLAGAGDMNGDGTADLIWQNGGTGQLYYWAMNGAAIIGGEGKTLPPGYTSRAVADLNGDGRVDVVISNGNDLRLVPTTASGGFGVSVAITGYPVGWTLAGAGDINGDGTEDLIWQNSGTSQLHYWAMGGSAIVGGAGKTLPPGYTSRAIGDFTGDGRADVVISNGQDLRLIPTTSAGNFGTSVAITGYPGGWTLL